MHIEMDVYARNIHPKNHPGGKKEANLTLKTCYKT